VFHFAAIARTPWTIEDPILCMATNLMGTTVVLEVARQMKIKRVVLSSSSVVYAAETPYKASKLGLEQIALAYCEMFGMSIICLRYSNVYGPRQSEEGPSPNVFAALRKSKKDTGRLALTGDGEQTRSYTHVSDIVEGNWLAMQSDWCGNLDLTTGLSTTLNDVAKYFDCPIDYIPERHGDIKHISQSPIEAKQVLGWEAKVKLADGIIDAL
jgi:UDP-glucose 4-epimerase